MMTRLFGIALQNVDGREKHDPHVKCQGDALTFLYEARKFFLWEFAGMPLRLTSGITSSTAVLKNGSSSHRGRIMNGTYNCFICAIQYTRSIEVISRRVPPKQ